MKPDRILSLLAVDAVLLPIRKGSKAPTIKGWQNLKFSNTQTPEYQRKLSRASSIGVLLGHPSQNLCSIDIDDDEALEAFLALNPSLASTLRTQGKRGANFWVIVEGDIPPTKTITDQQGNHVGEWRANRSQTIIAGQHRDGGRYRAIVATPPATLSFPNISWPPGWSSPHLFPPPLSEISEISLNSKLSETSTLSMPTLEKSFAQRVADAEKAREDLSQSRDLSAFYQKHIGRVYSPQQGQRNEQLVKIATHLFHVVGRKRSLELLVLFHHLNQDIFLDPLEQHIAEAKAHLNTLEQDYLSKLNSSELAIYQQLPLPHDEAFRICRDLASHETPACPPPEFFISHADLGFRLDIPKGNAGRLLASLMSLGALEIVEVGRKRTAGQRGQATRYRWKGEGSNK